MINEKGFVSSFGISEDSPDRNLGFKTGRFVYRRNSGELRFEDETGKNYDLIKIKFLTPFWNPGEGMAAMPKPFILEDNEIKETGDQVLYNYLDSRHEIILVLGSLADFKYRNFNDELDMRGGSPSAMDGFSITRANRNRTFTISADSSGRFMIFLSGEETADLGLKSVSNKENQGNIVLEATANIMLNLTDRNGKLMQQIVMNAENGVVRIMDRNNHYIELKEKGIVISTPKVRIGNNIETLQKILFDLLQAIKNMTVKTNTGNTIPVPNNWQSEFQPVINRINKFMDII